MKPTLLLITLILIVNFSFGQNKAWKDSISTNCKENIKVKYGPSQTSDSKLVAVDSFLYQQFFNGSKIFRDYDNGKAYYFSCFEDSKNGNYFKAIFLGHGHYTPFLLLVTLDTAGYFLDELIVAESFGDAGEAYETSVVINEKEILLTYNDNNIGYEPIYKNFERVYNFTGKGKIELVSETESMKEFE